MAVRLAFLAAAAVLAPFSQAAEQDTFTRANPAECGTQVNFLEYAKSLGPSVTCEGQQCDYKEQLGTTFDITYRQNYKVAAFSDSLEVEDAPSFITYVLYPCGLPKPNDDYIKGLKGNLSFVEIPVTAAASDDSTVSWMLEELELEDRVRYAGSFSTSPCMLKVASPAPEGCGRAFIGAFDMSGAPKTNATDYDVKFGFGNDVTNKEVEFQASTDPDPLGRAENLVYLAAFFNKEAKALQYFQGVQQRYNDAKTPPPGPDAPTIAWVSTSADVTGFGYVNPDGEELTGKTITFSFARYKSILTTSAGGNIGNETDVGKAPGSSPNGNDVLFAASEDPTNTTMAKAVQDLLKGVDIVIDETFAFGDVSLESFKMDMFLDEVDEADYPFLANKQVWRHDKDQTVGGADDWFGEAIARPDLVLLDLKAIIAPASVPNHTFKFFRDLAKGENVTQTSPADCTDLTCDAYENQAPLMVAAGAPAPESTATDRSAQVEAGAPEPADAAAEGAEGAAPEGAEVAEEASPAAPIAFSTVAAAVGAMAAAAAVAL